jgi:ribose 5-phosphate isomerase A
MASAKELVAQEIAKRVQNGELIGVGTGSTVQLALEAMRERVIKDGIRIQVVPSSLQSAWMCQSIGFTVIYPAFAGEIAWGFDGADQVDPNLWLIKGKGGALLQEKILIARCRKFVVVVDDSKMVPKLGVGCAIPVEIIPEARSIVEKKLTQLGATELMVRPAGTGKHGPVITEAANLIIDAQFDSITQDLESRIKSIVGVVESGLFVGYTSEVLVAGNDSVRSILP